MTVDQFLGIGLIRPSKFARAWSQVNPVLKPNGTFRFTLDFRGINKCIKSLGWVIPNTRFTLESIGQKNPVIFGMADLTMGYFQAALAERCCTATAFKTQRGIFEWTRVPQGLLPSAHYFQRVMAMEVFAEVVNKYAEIYIDDLLWWGTDETNYISRTRRIFEICREFGIKLNAKTKLGVSSVDYLGHTIDTNGINMTALRKKNTIAFKKPTSLKELQQFVGVANYFRAHIYNHSKLLHPLIVMITEANKIPGKHITWNDTADKAFETIKKTINECPSLFYFKPELATFLHTDASDYAIGAYLYQLDEYGKERPIRYYSKTLVGPQLRWSTIEKEGYAIYMALMEFEYMLAGRRFTLRTDHSNLQYLNEAGSKKVYNWKLAIQGFDMIIEYIKGNDNVVADVFSRLIEHSDQAQVNLIITPQYNAEQPKLLDVCHTFIGAHVGVNKTVQYLRTQYPDKTSPEVWPYLLHDVPTFIRACPLCQKFSRVIKPIQASRFVLNADRPMLKLDIDTIGPIEADANGNQYIIVMIDAFSRYVDLYPAKDASAISAAVALYNHGCKLGWPSLITTDRGSQYVNELFTHLLMLTGTEHNRTTPASKEENGLVERANKEVNRFIRNLAYEKEISKDWSTFLPTVMMFLNSSVKKSLGVSPNDILFGQMIDVTSCIFKKADEMAAIKTPPSDLMHYVSNLITMQQRIIARANALQQEQNELTLKQRLARNKLRDVHPYVSHHDLNDAQKAKKMKMTDVDTIESTFPNHADVAMTVDTLTNVMPVESDIVLGTPITPEFAATTVRKSTRTRKPSRKMANINAIKVAQKQTRFLCDPDVIDWAYQTKYVLSGYWMQNLGTANGAEWLKINGKRPIIAPSEPLDQVLTNLEKVFVNSIQANKTMPSFKIGDYVLKAHPTPIQEDRFGSFWKGPFMVESIRPWQDSFRHAVTMSVSDRTNDPAFSTLRPSRRKWIS